MLRVFAELRQWFEWAYKVAVPDKQMRAKGAAAMPAINGLSFLELLFICLTLIALFLGSILSWYFHERESKTQVIRQNSLAVSQWIRSVYLLKDEGIIDTIPNCERFRSLASRACFEDLNSENMIIAHLQNPYFPKGNNAALIAVAAQSDSRAGAGLPCGHLADQYVIATPAGIFEGRPKAWRGTILISVSDTPPQMSAGYCDHAGRYQMVESDAPVSKMGQ